MATRTGQITIVDVTDIDNIDVEYYASTSSTSLVGGNWQTKSPTWEEGIYIWQRTVITKTGTTDKDYLPDSNGVCVTGNTGKGVKNITEYYYQSVSATESPDITIKNGTIVGWTTTMPSYQSGYYYWTCSLIEWDDGTYTHTTAICANGITDIAEIAELAKETASSKITTFYSTTEPTTGMSTGDLWFNSTNNSVKRYDGTQWIDVDNTDIAQALQDAADAQSTADGKITTYYQSTAPTTSTADDLSVGDLWVDSDDGNKLYRYNGSKWVEIIDAGSKLARMYMAFYTQYGLYISNEDMSDIDDPTTLTSSYVRITSESVNIGNENNSHTQITDSSFKILTPEENLLIIDTANDNGSYEYTYEGYINAGGDIVYLPFSIASNTSSLTATFETETENSEGDSTTTTYNLSYGDNGFTINGSSNREIILTGDYSSMSGLFTMTYITNDHLYNFTVGSRFDSNDKGHGSVSIGNSNTAQGVYSFAEGLSNYSTGDMSVSLGVRNEAIGNASACIGDRNIIKGDYSVAIGQNNVATGRSSIAMGRRNNRYGKDYTIVENGDYSIALGLGNVAKGKASASLGSYNIVRSDYSFATGLKNIIGLPDDSGTTTSPATYSVALGTNNQIRASHSATIGSGNLIGTGATHGYCIGRNLTVPKNTTNQIVVGKYNKSRSDAIFVVGAGSSDENKKNAIVVNNSGNLEVTGDIEITGNIYGKGDCLYINTFVFTQSCVVSANSYEPIALTSVSHAGYTLIGVVGVSTDNVGSLAITKFYNSINDDGNEQITVVLKNLTSSSVSTTLRVKGLYRYKG